MSTESRTALTNILARDVMRRPLTCEATATLPYIAQVLSEHRIHCVLVDGTTKDRQGTVRDWGVVSDLDVVRGALAGGDVTASQIAGTDMPIVDANDDLETVAGALSQHDCSHVVVVDDERPVGVISTLDLAGVLSA